MKLALGMMVCAGEAPWLRLHLPTFVRQFDGVVFVYDPETDMDTIAAMYSYGLGPHVGATVDGFSHPWNWDFAEKFNHVLDHAEALGYDAILRLDADEAVYPVLVENTRTVLDIDGDKSAVLAYPRYNFERDRLHWMPQYYPDLQVRAWWLNQGIRMVGRVHEMPSSPMRYRMTDHLYHYEGLRTDAPRTLKHQNYHRLAQGLPPIYGTPIVNDPVVYRPHTEFVDAQPIDPQRVGFCAPFQEDF